MDYSWGDRNDLFVRNFSYVFQVRARELSCAHLRGKRIARAVAAWSAVTRIRGDPSHDTSRPLRPPSPTGLRQHCVVDCGDRLRPDDPGHDARCPD